MVSRAFRVSRGISLAITVGGVISSSLPSSLKEAEAQMNALRKNTQDLYAQIDTLSQQRDILPVESDKFKELNQQIAILVDKRKELAKESRNQASVLSNLKKKSERTIVTLRRMTLVIGAATTLTIGFTAAIVHLLNSFRTFDALATTATFGQEKLQRAALTVDLLGLNGLTAAQGIASINEQFTKLLHSGINTFDFRAIALSGLGFKKLRHISLNLDPVQQIEAFIKHYRSIKNDIGDLENFKTVIGPELFEAVRVAANQTDEQFKNILVTQSKLTVIGKDAGQQLFTTTKSWEVLGASLKSVASIMAITLTPAITFLGGIFTWLSGGLLGIIKNNKVLATALSFLTVGLVVSAFAWAAWVAIAKVSRTTADLYSTSLIKVISLKITDIGVSGIMTGVTAKLTFVTIAYGRALEFLATRQALAFGIIGIIIAGLVLLILNWERVKNAVVTGVQTILGWLGKLPNFIFRWLGGGGSTRVLISGPDNNYEKRKPASTPNVRPRNISREIDFSSITRFPVNIDTNDIEKNFYKRYGNKEATYSGPAFPDRSENPETRNTDMRDSGLENKEATYSGPAFPDRSENPESRNTDMRDSGLENKEATYSGPAFPDRSENPETRNIDMRNFITIQGVLDPEKAAELTVNKIGTIFQRNTGTR